MGLVFTFGNLLSRLAIAQLSVYQVLRELPESNKVSVSFNHEHTPRLPNSQIESHLFFYISLAFNS